MKRKRRVLVDCFHLLQAHSGIRTYTSELCQAIEENEFSDVEFVVYPNWKRVNEINYLRGKVNPFKKILNHLLFFFWKQICLPVILIVKRVDVLIAPDYVLPLMKFGKRGIAVVHDVFYWELKGNYNPIWRKYFLCSVLLGLNSKSSIVVTSKFIAKRVTERVTDKYPINVVYQAPKVLDSSDPKAFNLSKYGVPLDKKYFLHIGTFEKRKSLPTLVRAFKRLLDTEYFKDFYLILAGSPAVSAFHDDYRYVQQLVNELDLNERVMLPGFVPNNELGQLYKSAFAYIFPSCEEGFGIPVLEAAKVGIPTVISNQPALVELANGSALVFKMGNELDLFEKMQKLKDSTLRLSLTEKSDLIAKQFTRESFIKQFHCAVLKSFQA